MASAKMHIVRSGISRADVHEPKRSIVGHAVPDSTATALLPAVPRIPGFHGLIQLRLVLPAFCRVSRHREEAPAKFTAAAIVGGYIAARPREVRARVADDDNVARQQRRAGQRVGLLR